MSNLFSSKRGLLFGVTLRPFSQCGLQWRCPRGLAHDDGGEENYWAVMGSSEWTAGAVFKWVGGQGTNLKLEETGAQLNKQRCIIKKHDVPVSCHQLKL